jgi:poly(3-hydroxybutyrate) depolymerase
MGIYGGLMKQLLAAVMAGTFAFVAAAPVVAAEKTDPALAKACKDKKPGSQVIIAGKKTKCPAEKK